MSSGFDDVHDQLRAIARELLASTSVGTSVDRGLLAQAGWLGLEVPEACEGAGATFAEVAVVLEEMGRRASLSPYFGSAVLGVGALAMVESNPGRDQLLREVASGDLLLAVAVHRGDDDSVGGEPPFRIERVGNRLVLHGHSAFVPDVLDADRLLLVASQDEHGPVLVEVDPGAPGLAIEAQPVLDTTRRLGLVTATGVVLGDAHLRPFEGDPDASVRRLFDRAAAAVAVDSLGLAEAMLEATVRYTGVREQFGRPIGSFQAVKHACADMLVQVTIGRELCRGAIEQLVSDGPEASVAVSMAKSYMCAAAVDVVGAAMQLHGGIGYTWESGIHAYLKRATLNRALFASPAAHRRTLARRYT